MYHIVFEIKLIYIMFTLGRGKDQSDQSDRGKEGFHGKLKTKEI